MAERRTALVTGASSGLGKQLAKALLQRGWRVFATGRDEQRMASALDELAAVSEGADITMLHADLSLMADADRLAEDVAKRTNRLDLLANNAGGMPGEKTMTNEGLEASFAGNHLGAFLLTERLLPLLETTAKDREPGRVRILMTSSDASEMIPGIDLDDMQNLANWSAGAAYCTGKLANVLFAKALAERLAGTDIVAHAMAPGPTSTRFFANASPETLERIKDLPMRSEEEGADTLVWLATSDEAGQTSGGYWEDRKPKPANPVCAQEGVLDGFWQASEKLVRKALTTFPV